MNKKIETYQTKIRVDRYNDRHETYEVYIWAETNHGPQDTECFLCDVNGKFELHEIWSEMFDEYRRAPISDLERRNYPGIFERLERQLAEAIREYNLENEEGTEESWEILKPTIRSQL